MAGPDHRHKLGHMADGGSSQTEVRFAGARVIVRVRSAQSDGRVGIWESEEPRGTALPLHVHTREDEQVIVLAGTVSSLARSS